jgi:hypothetical protein
LDRRDDCGDLRVGLECRRGRLLVACGHAKDRVSTRGQLSKPCHPRRSSRWQKRGRTEGEAAGVREVRPRDLCVGKLLGQPTLGIQTLSPGSGGSFIGKFRSTSIDLGPGQGSGV